MHLSRSKADWDGRRSDQGETISELHKAITSQQAADDQTVWMTTAQAGLPLTRDEEELINSKDTQMGRPTARYLHPDISTFFFFFCFFSLGNSSSAFAMTILQSF
jgi:hypothetical protein